MGFILSLFVIGVGAVLRYAISVETNGVDLPLIGTIVMAVGIASAVATAVDWARDAWFEAEELEHHDDRPRVSEPITN